MDQSAAQMGVSSEDGMQQDEATVQLRLAVLNALSANIAAKRRDACGAKQSSGIENEFLSDEEFYQGYDDANRAEFVNSVTKPVPGASENEPKPKASGSTVFPNITQPYVDAAAARVGDMLLPTDDRNFAIEPTPIPDMFEGIESQIAMQTGAPPPGAEDQGAMPQMAEAQEQAQQPAAPEPQVEMEGQVMALSQAKARFDAMKADAARKAGKAQTRVDDWLVECQYHSELRKVIDDSAKLGSGVIKGPFPVMRKARQWRKDPESNVFKMAVIEEIKPASKRVDPWNLFPDPACGESIHNGAYIFERDFLTAKKLEELIDIPGYLADQIRMVLKQGPARQQEADARNLFSNAFANRDQFEIWYCYITLRTDDMLAAGVELSDAEQKKDSFPAIITMVNDVVIKATLNPLDSGDFPYDIIPWKRRPGMPWGMGVARQMRTPQRIVVAATRNLMDNAGLAAGPQIVLKRGTRPENGVYEIVPLKMWEQDEAMSGDDNSAAPLTSVVIPMLQNELMAIIQFGMKMAEDVTGLPMLLQGQQGKAPDTVGGMTILNNNANAVLRRIARLFDSSITEPQIRRYYAWLMDNSEDDDEKGDFQIKARGSSALVERDIQSQELVNIVQLCLNPAFQKNPAKAMDEFLKSRRFDPKNFDYTEEEKKKMAEQKPPEDPRIIAAQMQIEARKEEIAATLQAKADEADKERGFEQWATELDAKLASDKLSSEERRALETLKVQLTDVTLRLNTQKELSRRAERQDLEKHYNPAPVIAPGAEPIQRAENGMAFTQ